MILDILQQAFKAVQALISDNMVISGHDISEGGLITCLLEMTFSNLNTGMTVDLSTIEVDPVIALFNENPGVVIQVEDLEKVSQVLTGQDLKYEVIGEVNHTANLGGESGYTPI